ncbi:hypothetical protein TI39_contig839g00003 [Zymoseptoria brevis]|uniref:Amino acid permease like protein n=1 Tax=Zymoseptoria brevis TaxID=1047168 RepID=A0A0F4GF69_9PEZI|nr:hypothetical protein TI39_contig839g00003 [Zymoseptoria brevis]
MQSYIFQKKTSILESLQSSSHFNPRVNVSKGILSQLVTGLSFTFVFYIALLYGIADLDAVFRAPWTTFPLAAIYAQATSSTPATAALLVIFFLDIFITIPGSWTAGRMLWTLGRDDATPYPKFVGAISPRWRNPFNARIVCAAVGTVLTCIYIASATAFNAFVGLFIIFTTISYLAALLPHLLTRRRHILPGPFYMRGAKGDIIVSVACMYILVFNVPYMYPSTCPVASPEGMNWASVMFGGITACLTGWYWWKRKRGYVGPRVELPGKDAVDVGRFGLDVKVKERRTEES